jgi:ketopantoate reductase
VRISQQPTALEKTQEPRFETLHEALKISGFEVQRLSDMSGWLAYHAVFVSCIAAALLDCGTDPQRLAADRPELALMCSAITDGFRAPRAQGLEGLPRNLAILHSPPCGASPSATGLTPCTLRWESWLLPPMCAT